MLVFIDKFHYNAESTSLVHSSMKALDCIGHMDVVFKYPNYMFALLTHEHCLSAPIISFSDASFGYPRGPVLFKNLNFGIDLDSHISMDDPNGIDKSTLQNLILGNYN
jgi:ATP-binding cassette subfamily F protein 3